MSNARSLRSLLGTGWGLPFVPERHRPEPATAEGPGEVVESILLLLETTPGERLVQPELGAGLQRFAMRPNTAATRALIRREVQVALTHGEPRIELRAVSVTAGDDPALVLIAIDYLHKRDRSPASILYPFYLR